MRAVIVILMSLALLVAGVLVAVRTFTDDSSCMRPPSSDEEAQQEVFVRLHIPDAHSINWTVMDCDDYGQAFVSFTTTLSPEQAGAAFLSDPNCSSSKEPGASPADVSCTSEPNTVSIHFESTEGMDTFGELNLELT